MSSTNTFLGMENVSKPTSRVLAPPGGKTNFSLGGGVDEPAPAAPKQSSEENDAPKQEAGKQVEQDLYKPSPAQPIRPAENSYANVFGVGDPSDQSANAPRGRRRYPQQTDIGHNPVTGEPNRDSQQAPAADSPPTKGRAKPERIDPASMPAAGGRVETKAPIRRQPPGGKDSGIFS